MDAHVYTESVANTAMCLWEAYVDAEEGTYPALDALRENMGTATLREYVLSVVAAACDEGWEIAHADGGGFDGPFDWEFCPLFLKYCVGFDRAGWRLALAADWQEVCAVIGDCAACGDGPHGFDERLEARICQLRHPLVPVQPARPDVNRENIIALATFIESGLFRFDMKNGRAMPACGSAGCIGGHAAVLVPDLRHNEKATRVTGGGAENFTWNSERFADWLGVTRSQHFALCFPDIQAAYEATPEQAGKVLRKLARTGEVDWSII